MPAVRLQTATCVGQRGCPSWVTWVLLITAPLFVVARMDYPKIDTGRKEGLELKSPCLGIPFGLALPRGVRHCVGNGAGEKDHMANEEVREQREASLAGFIIIYAYEN